MRPTARPPGILLLVAALLGGCTNEGEPPPVGRLVFPIALGLSPSGEHLFVANSNFDLRYNAGSLQSYDVDVLNQELDRACRDVPPSERDACGIIPEEDVRDDLTEAIRPVQGLLVDQVRIGSFADGMAVAPYGDAARVYLPVRSDANLTYVDVVGGQFDCGPGAPDELGRRCDDAHRRGEDEAATLRGIELPADPVGVAVGPLADVVSPDRTAPEGNYVLFAHRDGRASLFFDEPEGDSTAPVLVHTLSGLPSELVDITVDPRTRVAWAPSAREPVLARVGIAFDGATREPDRSFLFDAGGAYLSGIDTGSASRGDTRLLRFDPRPEVERAYILARRPRALLIADTSDASAAVPVLDVVPVGFGPSRLEIATIDVSDPEDDASPPMLRTLAFVSCFDTRDLYVIDVDLGELVGIVRSLGGPFELVVDPGRGKPSEGGYGPRVYVADFRTSVVRVVDLGPMAACLRGATPDDGECSPQLLGVVGRPVAVRELR